MNVICSPRAYDALCDFCLKQESLEIRRVIEGGDKDLITAFGIGVFSFFWYPGLRGMSVLLRSDFPAWMFRNPGDDIPAEIEQAPTEVERLVELLKAEGQDTLASHFSQYPPLAEPVK